VVPAFDEPYVTELLFSLSRCKPPSCKAEVIVVINANRKSSPQSLANNLITVAEIESWRKKNPDCFFRTYAINLGQPSIKGWGAGLARKTGMDEALRRFSAIGKPEGVIVCLDADCTVQDNYFVSIENELFRRKDRKGCSIYFEHILEGDRFPEIVYSSAFLYELHLRYYYQALSYSGFPYAYHTVGSAIAVKSLPYLLAGGMNRREAGEDFYFVQKLVPAGGYFSLNTTTVYPSPRESDRVPFGTGPVVRELVAKKERQLLTYNPMAFKDLRLFFGMLEKLFDCRPDEIAASYQSLPASLSLFIDEKKFKEKLTEIRNNTSGFESFRKRFFTWFNMFSVVKYLNFTHKSFFSKIPVTDAAEELLRLKKIRPDVKGKSNLLNLYRNFEKSSIS
jgi:hypothetical protein